MSQFPSMPMWWSDFFNKTDHLSNEEQWAYAKLMAKTWIRNCQPFPDNAKDIARALDMGEKRWLKIRPRIAPFFDLSDGTWRQLHLEKVFLGVTQRAQTSRSNGALGGRPVSRHINELKNPAGSSRLTQKEPIQKQKEEDRDSETLPETQNLDQNAASRRNGSYAFSGKLVRINQQQFDKWREINFGIADLMAALATLDDYYDAKLEGKERGNWFIRCSKALEKEHQKALAARQAPPRAFTIGIG